MELLKRVVGTYNPGAYQPCSQEEKNFLIQHTPDYKWDWHNMRILKTVGIVAALLAACSFLSAVLGIGFRIAPDLSWIVEWVLVFTLLSAVMVFCGAKNYLQSTIQEGYDYRFAAGWIKSGLEWRLFSADKTKLNAMKKYFLKCLNERLEEFTEKIAKCRESQAEADSALLALSSHATTYEIDGIQSSTTYDSELKRLQDEVRRASRSKGSSQNQVNEARSHVCRLWDFLSTYLPSTIDGLFLNELLSKAEEQAHEQGKQKLEFDEAHMLPSFQGDTQ